LGKGGKKQFLPDPENKRIAQSAAQIIQGKIIGHENPKGQQAGNSLIIENIQTNNEGYEQNDKRQNIP